ncbi:unnamed protein product [Amoebophrya sp. A25]|nr:unnamed protein product [Amoebophrya sp. A25]|eukprot:GSA25T00013617001.1
MMLRTNRRSSALHLGVLLCFHAEDTSGRALHRRAYQSGSGSATGGADSTPSELSNHGGEYDSQQAFDAAGEPSAFVDLRNRRKRKAATTDLQGEAVEKAADARAKPIDSENEGVAGVEKNVPAADVSPASTEPGDEPGANGGGAGLQQNEDALNDQQSKKLAEEGPQEQADTAAEQGVADEEDDLGSDGGSGCCGYGGEGELEEAGVGEETEHDKDAAEGGDEGGSGASTTTVEAQEKQEAATAIAAQSTKPAPGEIVDNDPEKAADEAEEAEDASEDAGGGRSCGSSSCGGGGDEHSGDEDEGDVSPGEAAEAVEDEKAVDGTASKASAHQLELLERQLDNPKALENDAIQKIMERGTDSGNDIMVNHYAWLDHALKKRRAACEMLGRDYVFRGPNHCSMPLNGTSDPVFQSKLASKALHYDLDVLREEGWNDVERSDIMFRTCDERGDVYKHVIEQCKKLQPGASGSGSTATAGEVQQWSDGCRFGIESTLKHLDGDDERHCSRQCEASPQSSGKSCVAGCRAMYGWSALPGWDTLVEDSSAILTEKTPWCLNHSECKVRQKLLECYVEFDVQNRGVLPHVVATESENDVQVDLQRQEFMEEFQTTRNDINGEHDETGEKQVTRDDQEARRWLWRYGCRARAAELDFRVHRHKYGDGQEGVEDKEREKEKEGEGNQGGSSFCEGSSPSSCGGGDDEEAEGDATAMTEENIAQIQAESKEACHQLCMHMPYTEAARHFGVVPRFLKECQLGCDHCDNCYSECGPGDLLQSADDRALRLHVKNLVVGPLCEGSQKFGCSDGLMWCHNHHGHFRHGMCFLSASTFAGAVYDSLTYVTQGNYLEGRREGVFPFAGNPLLLQRSECLSGALSVAPHRHIKPLYPWLPNFESWNPLGARRVVEEFYASPGGARYRATTPACLLRLQGDQKPFRTAVGPLVGIRDGSFGRYCAAQGGHFIGGGKQAAKQVSVSANAFLADEPPSGSSPQASFLEPHFARLSAGYDRKEMAIRDETFQKMRLKPDSKTVKPPQLTTDLASTSTEESAPVPTEETSKDSSNTALTTTSAEGDGSGGPQWCLLSGRHAWVSGMSWNYEEMNSGYKESFPKFVEQCRKLEGTVLPDLLLPDGSTKPVADADVGFLAGFQEGPAGYWASIGGCGGIDFHHPDNRRELSVQRLLRDHGTDAVVNLKRAPFVHFNGATCLCEESMPRKNQPCLTADNLFIFTYRCDASGEDCHFSFRENGKGAEEIRFGKQAWHIVENKYGVMKVDLLADVRHMALREQPGWSYTFRCKEPDDQLLHSREIETPANIEELAYELRTKRLILDVPQGPPKSEEMAEVATQVDTEVEAGEAEKQKLEAAQAEAEEPRPEYEALQKANEAQASQDKQEQIQTPQDQQEPNPSHGRRPSSAENPEASGNAAGHAIGQQDSSVSGVRKSHTEPPRSTASSTPRPRRDSRMSPRGQPGAQGPSTDRVISARKTSKAPTKPRSKRRHPSTPRKETSFMSLPEQFDSSGHESSFVILRRMGEAAATGASGSASSHTRPTTLYGPDSVHLMAKAPGAFSELELPLIDVNNGFADAVTRPRDFRATFSFVRQSERDAFPGSLVLRLLPKDGNDDSKRLSMCEAVWESPYYCVLPALASAPKEGVPGTGHEQYMMHGIGNAAHDCTSRREVGTSECNIGGNIWFKDHESTGCTEAEAEFEQRVCVRRGYRGDDEEEEGDEGGGETGGSFCAGCSDCCCFLTFLVVILIVALPIIVLYVAMPDFVSRLMGVTGGPAGMQPTEIEIEGRNQRHDERVHFASALQSTRQYDATPDAATAGSAGGNSAVYSSIGASFYNSMKSGAADQERNEDGLYEEERLMSTYIEALEEGDTEALAGVPRLSGLQEEATMDKGFTPAYAPAGVQEATLDKGFTPAYAPAHQTSGRDGKRVPILVSPRATDSNVVADVDKPLSRDTKRTHKERRNRADASDTGGEADTEKAPGANSFQADASDPTEEAPADEQASEKHHHHHHDSSTRGTREDGSESHHSSSTKRKRAKGSGSVRLHFSSTLGTREDGPERLHSSSTHGTREDGSERHHPSSSHGTREDGSERHHSGSTHGMREDGSERHHPSSTHGTREDGSERHHSSSAHGTREGASEVKSKEASVYHGARLDGTTRLSEGFRDDPSRFTLGDNPEHHEPASEGLGDAEHEPDEEHGDEENDEEENPEEHEADDELREDQSIADHVADGHGSEDDAGDDEGSQAE